MNSREKLLLAWALTATLLLLVAGFIVLQMLRPSLPRAARLAGFDDVPIGSATLFVCEREMSRCVPTTGSLAVRVDDGSIGEIETHGDIVQIWLTREDLTEFHAFSVVSTHLGCMVLWNADTNRFEDPCGGAKWKRDGTYQSGPAPRNLDYFPVRIEDGVVYIDFNLKRGKEHG